MNQYIGKRLGSYQILEQIGKGGMATIFKAYQPSMDRYVAVKILPSHFTEDETFVERFNQEAHTLARLQHPFILPVHDYGEQEGITYLVMRYITAGTLKDLIARRAPMELNEAARILGQVGDALGYAHSEGVIHRDIKPTNVLIDERGVAFLTDFGIAKLVAGTSQFTATGAIVGTPAYMSPEQGMAEPLDHRSDIYSLGVVLYEMVTGRVPFEAETPLAVLLKHVNASLPPPRQVKPDLPESVERVILKAMAKAPEDRFQQAEEMVEALQQAVASIPTEIIRPRPAVEPAQTISVPPAPPVAQEPLPETVIATPPRKALPWVPIAGGVAALAAVIIAALLVLPNLGGGGAPGEATSTAARLVAQATDGPATTSTLPPAAAEPVATSTPPAASVQPPATGGIVLDNGGPGFTIEAGTWGSCWDGDCGGISYGDDFRYANPGCTSCRARFDFSVPTAGEYDVWTWWPQGEDRATDTPFTIVYGAESFTVKVDQRNQGSTWYKLGTFTFEAGESVSVIVAGADSGYANADAVALSPAEAEAPSPAWTNYTNSNQVRALARQDHYLWTGGSGGLVRWDLNDGSHVRFGIADGLASTWVNDLLVDEEGIVWVATDAGISRFDGATWLTFSELDGLDSDTVHTLFIDPDGGLWAGTEDGELGLSYYDGTDWGHLLPPLPFDDPTVLHLAMDKNYRVWANLAGEGLAYFNGTEWETYTSDDGLPDDWFSDLLLADDDTLLASFDNGVVRRDPETGRWATVSQLDDLSISAMHQASDGSLWFGGRAGAIRYDPETGDWQAFEARPGAIPDERVTTIIEDENGLWLGTDGAGVVFYDGNSWEPWASDDTLAGNNVWAIRQDGSGALWFLHEDGDGLSRYDPAGETWQTFGDDEGALDWPTAVTVDGDGTLWIGGQRELKWYDGRGWQTFAPDQLDDDTVFGVAFAPDGVQWFRTDAGVIRHDPATDDWTTFSADDHAVLEAVQALDVTRDGIVWAGGADGLVYYDQGSWSEPDAAGDAPTRDVDEIAEAPDGGLWVVADGALYNLADDYWTRFNWPSDGWIETLAFGPDGMVWVGSDGLARFDPFSGDWQIFTTDDGLVYWNVETIYVTPAGVVWVGTRGGVSRYVPAGSGTAAPRTGATVDDFESGDFDDRWWSFTDEGTVSFTCAPDQPGHASAHAMRLTFEVGADGWPGCAIDTDPNQWVSARGLSFFWRADQAGLTVYVILGMEDPTQTSPRTEGATPFSVKLQTTVEWTSVVLEWDDFARAGWVDEGGVDVLDPTAVFELIFQVDPEQSGAVWIDDLQLMTDSTSQ